MTDLGYLLKTQKHLWFWRFFGLNHIAKRKNAAIIKRNVISAFGLQSVLYKYTIVLVSYIFQPIPLIKIIFISCAKEKSR